MQFICFFKYKIYKHYLLHIERLKLWLPLWKIPTWNFQKKQKWKHTHTHNFSNLKVLRLNDLGHRSCAAPRRSLTRILSAHLTQFLPKMTHALLNKIPNSGLKSLMLDLSITGQVDIAVFLEHKWPIMPSFKTHVRHSPLSTLSCFFVQREEVFKHKCLYINIFSSLTQTFLRMRKYVKTHDFWDVQRRVLVNFYRGLNAD